ncbi:AraC family transcriptional regulator [Neoroseomonas lacus]|uniref:AraC family transcriptional regulator n=1 Tax=Neoroseomonas lacus TaxID=287609 RepID=A0A917P1B8_9PROT|nr:AraC family transcriptional regulator [Neoroseomonas lacus]GGJ44554.1 AraC family transcriptional regulator [Neoroseomonas lacus]
MDPLSAVIDLLRPSTAVSKPITALGNWGVRYSAYDAPGFALVVEGDCWLALSGEAPIRLRRGDFLLFPLTPAFEMSNRPGGACIQGEPGTKAVRYGDQVGDPDFRMLGGTFSIEPMNALLLLTLLPKQIHIRAMENDTTRLARIISLIVEECGAARPGGPTILDRLLEILMIEALRDQEIGGANSAPAGLIAGLREPAVAEALRLMHAHHQKGWTVAELAKAAGLSRSTFAAQFLRTVGCAPIEYLSRWRMAIAKNALCRGKVSLDRLAVDIGYESASAFSTAFRRHVGCAPRQFARSYGPAASSGPSG